MRRKETNISLIPNQRKETSIALITQNTLVSPMLPPAKRKPSSMGLKTANPAQGRNTGDFAGFAFLTDVPKSAEERPQVVQAKQART